MKMRRPLSASLLDWVYENKWLQFAAKLPL